MMIVYILFLVNYKAHTNNDLYMASSNLKSSVLSFDPAPAEKKICRFLQKEVEKSGAEGVILGVSGGIDSALAAALSAKALGPKKVCAVFFYAAENEEAENAVFESCDFKDAFSLCASLLVSFHKINIGALFKSAQKLTKNNKTAVILSGNLMSRLRMSLLYYYANQ
jgi:NAD+ synthase